jgi:two-component system, sensor histidine kinase and response regulator
MARAACRGSLALYLLHTFHWPTATLRRQAQNTTRVMSTIYDYPGSLRRMGDDRELFQEMVGLLRSDAPHWLSDVLAAEREGDPVRLQRSAHTLKGLAANFGAARAVAAAAVVEQLGKSQQTVGLPAAVIELEESLDELLAALTPLREPIAAR